MTPQARERREQMASAIEAKPFTPIALRDHYGTFPLSHLLSEGTKLTHADNGGEYIVVSVNYSAMTMKLTGDQTEVEALISPEWLLAE